MDKKSMPNPGRSRSSRLTSTPYSTSKEERSGKGKGKSLMKKLKDTVKDLLTPSWLGSIQSSNAAESESSDSSRSVSKSVLAVSGSNQEMPDVPVVYGPSSYMETGSPASSLRRYSLLSQTMPAVGVPQSHYQMAEQPAVPILPMTQTVGGSVFTQHNSYSQSPNVSVNDSKSDSTNVSDKPAAESTEGQSSRALRARTYLDGSTVNTSISKVADTDNRSSIMDESDNLNKSSSMNISSLAKTLGESLNGSILGSKHLNNSSFYVGKTTFGGRSSRRSLQIPTATPYKRVDSRSSSRSGAKAKVEKNIQSRPAVTTSKAAQLILNALEQTGLETNDKNGKASLFSPAVYLRKKDNMGGTKTIVGTPPLTRFTRSSQAKIVPNLHKQGIEQPNSSFAKPNSYSSVKVQDLSSPNFAPSAGGKLRHERRTQLHYSSGAVEDYEICEVPDLPTQFTLPVSSMPKIDLSPSTAAKFSFSSPNLVEVGGQTTHPLCLSAEKFEFSAPMVISEKLPGISSPSVTAKSTAASNWGDLLKTSASKWTCECCLIKNDSTSDACVACTTKRPSNDVSSDTTAVGSSSITGSSGSGWGDIMKNSADQWSCSSCLLKNNKNLPKCAACGAKNPSSSATVPVAVTPSAISAGSGWGDLFKNASVKWSCASCLVQNSDDKMLCVACGTAKPGAPTSNAEGAATTQSSTSANTGTGWGDLFKQSASMWSCSACLVKNDASITNCVACNTKNPKDAATKQMPVTSEVPVASGTGWGNLLTASVGKWSCKDCLVKNGKEVTSCVACGSKNPTATAPETESKKSLIAATTSGWGDLLQQSTDTWSCSSCLLKNKNSAVKCVACGSSNPAAGSSKAAAVEPVKTVASSGWGDLFKKSEGEWSCESCMVSNPADKDTCIACCSVKPSKASGSLNEHQADLTGTATAGWASTSHSTFAPSPGGWGTLFQSKSSLWKCLTCLVTNPDNLSMCSSCGAYKPGTQSSLGDLDKGNQLPNYEEKTDVQPVAAGFGNLASLFSKHSAENISTSQPATTAVSSPFSSPSLAIDSLPVPASNDKPGFGTFQRPAFQQTAAAAASQLSTPVTMVSNNTTSQIRAMSTSTIAGGFGFNTAPKLAQSNTVTPTNPTQPSDAPNFGGQTSFGFKQLPTKASEPSNPLFQFLTPQSSASTGSQVQPKFQFGSTQSSEGRPAENTAAKKPMFSFGAPGNSTNNSNQFAFPAQPSTDTFGVSQKRESKTADDDYPSSIKKAAGPGLVFGSTATLSRTLAFGADRAPISTGTTSTSFGPASIISQPSSQTTSQPAQDSGSDTSGSTTSGRKIMRAVRRIRPK